MTFARALFSSKTLESRVPLADEALRKVYCVSAVSDQDAG